MKFLSYVTKSGQESWGVLGPNDKIFDLSTRAPTLVDFLRGKWEEQLPIIQSSLKNADVPLHSVKLLACVPRPPSMRDGYAFRQHVEAARRNRGVPMIAEFDLAPTFYYTNHQAVVGPGPVPVMPKQLEQLDFELESAIVIGKQGRNIRAQDADKYIFGYTIMNDLSARKEQMEEMKMSLGPAKGKDFATALGAWLVTKDELESYRRPGPTGDRYALEMTCDVNGVPISKGNMADMNWTFAQIIERVSYGTTIYPGDVIGSGTVGTGCFMELNGSGITKQWLKPGDKVVLRIAGLGELENTIIEEQA
ncbi:MAG: fumarylacetoacetate hydrolase family protein [Bdellovibrionales bacterium]|nr:fumarylacetoacetate hydrolase family protein [Bdellovibrionales bacterium]